MDLPPELRNKIYGYCVTSNKALLLRGTCICKPPLEELALRPSVTRVCRQLRAEALPLFYLLNEFEAHINKCDFRHFIREAKKIRAAGIFKIGKVHFEITAPNEDDSSMMCAAGLEDVVLWFATIDLDIADWTVWGEMSGSDENLIRRALKLSNDLVRDDLKGGKKRRRTIKKSNRQAFRRWVRAEGLKCCGDLCGVLYDMWCSKTVCEEGWTCVS